MSDTRLVVAFGDEGRGKEINIQRETLDNKTLSWSLKNSVNLLANRLCSSHVFSFSYQLYDHYIV